MLVRRSWRRTGFTLIELLVVIAIIAILMSILMPALNGARRQTRAVVCATNLGSVGKAFHVYLAENQAVFPPSYIYPSDFEGAYDLMGQPSGHPYGYMHWSWFLFQSGEVKDEAFRCPEMPRGGAPRTNPGPNAGDWEPNQLDQNGNGPSSGATLTDKQARRMAFTVNAAIVPRNKFTSETFEGEGAAGVRRNRLVTETRIADPRGVILATEFSADYANIGVDAGGGHFLSKSHRPINPFYHISAGFDEYAAQPSGEPGFVYPDPKFFADAWPLPLKDLEEQIGVIDGQHGTELNAIGRHHPGGDKLGGSTNFLFTDAHVERKTLAATLLGRQWGNEYLSLDEQGNNEVRWGY